MDTNKVYNLKELKNEVLNTKEAKKRYKEKLKTKGKLIEMFFDERKFPFDVNVANDAFNIVSNIIEELKKVRLEQKLTQEQMAKKLNISREMISRIESGNENLTFLTLFKFLAVYGIPVSKIFKVQQ
jgi:DNA-binding XRE family transcriptional regulator